MKKLCAIFAIACIIFSCKTEPMEEEVNPFVGEWEIVGGTSYFIFTEKNVMALANKTAENTGWEGTYTYDESIITYYFTYNPDNFENPYIQMYKIEGDILTLDGQGFPATYKKVK